MRRKGLYDSHCYRCLLGPQAFIPDCRWERWEGNKPLLRLLDRVCRNGLIGITALSCRTPWYHQSRDLSPVPNLRIICAELIPVSLLLLANCFLVMSRSGLYDLQTSLSIRHEATRSIFRPSLPLPPLRRVGRLSFGMSGCTASDTVVIS